MQIEKDKTPNNIISSLGLSKGSSDQILNNGNLGKAEFLRLLVTQLNYQDPLEPLKNEEFIAQTAQFSALEQMQELNKTILSQIPLQRTISNAMAVQYVGKIVEAPGSKVALAEGQPAKLGARLSENADVTFEIYNATGKLVSSLDLGTQNASTLHIEWDGRDENGRPLPDGIYTYKVNATNHEGKSVSVTPLMLGRVSGVAYENNQALLSLHGELVPPNDIFSASLP